MMLLAAASLPLGACASTHSDSLARAEPAPMQPTYQSAAAPACRSVGNSALTGAGVGAAAGVGVGALASGVGLLEGALIGAAVGGLAGAIWADSNNDGCVDGYVREGRYYEGAPMVQPAPSTYRTGERG
jgi:outer membrane lipoprotein SlyB